ncbi:hypothetical protein BDR05DRAFT_985656, partial [Suillus weaverae]
ALHQSAVNLLSSTATAATITPVSSFVYIIATAFGTSQRNGYLIKLAYAEDNQ